MIQRLNKRLRSVFNRPIRVVIYPAALSSDGRFAVGIDNDLKAKLTEAFRKMCYKQLCSTVIRRGYGDERRRNESDFQFYESLRPLSQVEKDAAAISPVVRLWDKYFQKWFIAQSFTETAK